MKREHRLRKGPEFDTAYAKGTVIGGPLVVLRMLPNELGYARWGFAVGKKLAPLSTTRNRVRRLFREAVQSLDGQESYDIIVTARREALTATLDELRGGIVRGIDKHHRAAQ